jgi:hypothetical protein
MSFKFGESNIGLTIIVSPCIALMDFNEKRLTKIYHINHVFDIMLYDY